MRQWWREVTLDMASKADNSRIKSAACLNGTYTERNVSKEKCHPARRDKRQAREIFLPATAHILDYYDRMTPEEKNRLWKLLMEKTTYHQNPEKPDRIERH